MPKLLIQEGGQQSVFELFDDEATIGRGAANPVQVADSRASKVHAVVRKVHGRLKLVDLESRNGTRVNGEFRNQRWLEHGDVIAIGEMTMTYDGSDVPAAAVAAPARPAAVMAVPVPVAAPRAPAPVVVAHRRPHAGGHARPHHAHAEGEEGEHPHRAVPRRRDNSLAIAVLVGAGLILAVFLLFKMMGSGGTSNASALAEAKRIANRGDVGAAIAYLESNSDPRDVDGYKSVADQLRSWKSTIEDEGRQRLEVESVAAMKQIQKDVVEQHKNGLSDVQLGRTLIDWAEKYAGTVKAMELQNSQVPPYPQLRALMDKARK